MKRIVLALLFLFSISFAFSQKGFHKIGVGFDLGLPVGEFKENYKTGYGGYIKLLLGVSDQGNVTFTSGYTNYKFIPNTYYKSGKVNIVPVMGGYRHNFKGFYIEPQIGVTIYSLDFTGIGGTPRKDSETGFSFCGGIGYTIRNVDIGFRFEGGTVDLSNFSLFGFRLGYNFPITKH